MSASETMVRSPPRPREVWPGLFASHIITVYDLVVPARKRAYDALDPQHRPVWIRQFFEADETVWEDYTKLRQMCTDFVLILGDRDGYYRFEMDPQTFKAWLSFRHAEEMLLELDLISFLKNDDLRWVLFTRQYESYWRQARAPLALEFQRGSVNHVYLTIRRTDLSSLKAAFKWTYVAIEALTTLESIT